MIRLQKTIIVLGVLILVLVPIVLYVPHAPAPNTSQAPAMPAVEEGWTMFTGDVLTFQYPAELPTTYIHATDWPPKAALSNGPFTCTEGRTEIGETRKTTVSDRPYCVTAMSEGAAGSTYIDYTYATEKDGKTITLAFTIREVQCGNYDDPQKNECEKERAMFSVDELTDRIVQTLKLL